MKLLRCIALSFCLVPLCHFGAVAQAAQPAAEAQARQAKPAQKAPAKPVSKQAVSKAKPKPKPKPKPKSARKPVSKAVAKPLPQPKLDLSLPVEMVNDLEPNVGSSATRRKPLLPAMFTEKPQGHESPFQLNGRLISNEMQLQLRNESRRDVEGAAIEFEYRQ
ncbi:hypothetical protein SHV42_05345 [Pseudomonas capeferrum]|uniref:hypothetical protein n=1 Tax=Pseudomonas TaxID=286 RepID=UPI0016448EEF|nr:hypothetical protein [Pseudomonas sp. SWRI77]MBC3481480.1 hypothetical protein [Pseudomonas sp. SWRI77]